MKSVFKIFTTGILFIFCTAKLSAQSVVSIGVNADAGNSSFKPDGKRGFGGSIEWMPRMWKNGGLKLVVGYDWFDRRVPKGVDPVRWQDSIKNYGIVAQDVHLLPVRLGYTQRIWRTVFVSGEVGFTHIFTGTQYNGNKNWLSYAVGIGYKLTGKDSRFLQISTKYNYNRVNTFLQLNYFSFGLAYGLQFRKGLLK